jgi:hypothetical protein
MTFGVRLSLHVTFLGEITEFPIVESTSEGSYPVSTMEEPSGGNLSSLVWKSPPDPFHVVSVMEEPSGCT